MHLYWARGGDPFIVQRGTLQPDPPTALMRRRLVLCLDGTWNSTYRLHKRTDGHAVLKPSNVLKLARAVTSSLVYYDIGVGSLARYPGLSNRLLALADKGLGGGWGAGFEGNVEDALEFLVLNHEPGDEVFVFGFSRGAVTAQAVTRFLDWSGGLPVKRDAYYVPRLFREYVMSRGQTTSVQVLEKINAERFAAPRPLAPLEPFQAVDVVFLGVWDSVMALGSRFRAVGSKTSTKSRSFHVGMQPARCVRHARQALAVDEARFDFRPEIWRNAHSNQTLEQRWFAGVHSNVGGGYVDDGLANLALRWMLKEAEAFGLTVDRSFVSKYRGYAQDRLYRSESMAYRVFDGLRRRAGRGRRSLVDFPPSGCFALDPSVIWRMQANPDDSRHPDLRRLYRPENVLCFLATQPDIDSYLEKIGADPAKLPEDVRERVSE